MADTLPLLEESFATVLCVAAHPDDLEYGAAAAVDKWRRAGVSVTYLLATRGEAGIDGMHPEEAGPVREQEERDGAAEVGVDVVEFLGHPDGVLEYGLPLRRGIAREIRVRRPDLVLTLTHRERFAGGGTNMADHRVLGLAALDACRDAGNRWVFPELVAEGLEPWQGVRRLAFAASPEATHAIDVTGHLAAAVASLAAHRRYLGGLPADYPSPEELLGSILGGGGRLAGSEHALAVEVLDL